MKVALVQFAPHLGDIGKNLDLHLEYIERAREAKAQLVVFPELSLTGYTLKDLVPGVALDPAGDPLFKTLADAGEGLSLVLGFVEEKAAEQGLFYNSAAFLADGKILHIHRKVFLPTYGFLEEAKFFAPGRNFSTFLTPFGRVGLMICRDFLHYGASYLLFAGGAEIIIVISAAPGRGVSGDESFETSRMWELMGEAVSYFSSAFVIYCNRVGLEDGVSFAGGSFIYSPEGRQMNRASYGDPEMLLQDPDLSLIRNSRKIWPFKRDDKPEVILQSLARIVRDYED